MLYFLRKYHFLLNTPTHTTYALRLYSVWAKGMPLSALFLCNLFRKRLDEPYVSRQIFINNVDKSPFINIIKTPFCFSPFLKGKKRVNFVKQPKFLSSSRKSTGKNVRQPMLRI